MTNPYASPEARSDPKPSGSTQSLLTPFFWQAVAGGGYAAAWHAAVVFARADQILAIRPPLSRLQPLLYLVLDSVALRGSAEICVN